MDRHQATHLLKELVDNNFIQPTLVSLQRTSSGGYRIILKIEGDHETIKRFVKEKNLTFEPQKEKGYCIICKTHP